MSKELNREVFDAGFATLRDRFRTQFNPETQRLTSNAYYELLKWVDLEDFRKGIKNAMALEFFPSASKLKELCYDGKTEEQRAFEKNSAPKDAPQLESVEQKHPEILEQNRDSLNLLWRYNSLLFEKGHSQKEIIAMARDGSIAHVLRKYFDIDKPEHMERLLLDEVAERLPLEKQKSRAFQDNRENALKLIEKWKEEGAS